MISTVVGCIFFQVASKEFTSFIQVQSTFGALLMALMANAFSTALPSLTALPEERPVFLREYSTNHYSVMSYFSSRLVMELVVTAVQVTVSSVLTYFLVGFSGQFGIFWAGLYLMACASTALGVLVGSSASNPSVATELLPAIFLPQILFSGFFVPPGLMPVWLGWIRWICPLTYGVKILVAVEFDNGRCDDTSPPHPDFCQQILDNVEASFDDIWWYFLVLLSLFVFFRLLALYSIKSKAEQFY
jgi:ABC-type multidrug transport system permease subunit